MDNYKVEVFDVVANKMKKLAVYGGASGSSNWRIKKIWKHMIEQEGLNPIDILPNVDYGDPRTIVYINGRFKEIVPEKLKHETVYTQVINNFENYKFKFSRSVSLREMYDFIKMKQEETGNVGFAVLYYQGKEDPSKVLHISINQNNLDSFEEFVARKEQIESGNLEGSDRYDENTYELIRDVIGLTVVTITGFGTGRMLFKSENIKETKRGKGDCLLEVRKTILNKYNLTEKDYLSYVSWKHDKLYKEDNRKTIQAAEDLSSFIYYKIKVKINIFGNSMRLKSKMNDIQKRETFKVDNFKLSPINDDDIMPVQLTEVDDKAVNSHCIIYCENTQHWDFTLDSFPRLENIYLSRCYKVWKKEDDKFTKLFNPTDMSKTNHHRPTKNEMIYVAFDYETVVDYNEYSCMKPYSISFTFLNEEQLEAVNDLDRATDPAVRQQLKDKIPPPITYVGWDCNERFVNTLLQNQVEFYKPIPNWSDKEKKEKEDKRPRSKIYSFISFNGANFDNFIFLDYLLKNRHKHPEYKVSDIFYNGNQLLNFKLNDIHNCFDIRKHLVGSLDYNCKSFKVETMAKTSMNHWEVQKLYDNDPKNFFNNLDTESLIKYNELDVLSTAIIFFRYRKALKSISLTKPFGEKLTDIKTIGSIIWSVFQENQRKKNIKLPSLTKEQYEDLQRYKIAGRVEMFNGIQEIEEEMMSLDVCSLYPYVMACLNCYYPCGELVETKKFKKGKIGFYYCDVDQSNLKDKNLPPLYAAKTETENDWKATEFKDYLFSTVMIEQFQRYGCKIKIKSGFYFTDKIKSCELFGFLLDLMKAKNEQDTFKKTDPGLYNAALRETLKLLMNSISGKVIEGLHTNKTCEVTSYKYHKLLNDDKVKKLNSINVIGDKVFCSYEVDMESELKKQRPVYLGVMIYDYAKRYMYNEIYAPIGLKNLVYTDTDAAKFRTRHYESIKEHMNKEVPHWKEIEKVDPRYKGHKLYDEHSKVFGSFENELDANNYFACFQKKAWVCCKDNQVLLDGGKPKMGFKGVPSSSIILEGNEDIYNDDGTIDQMKANDYYATSKNKIYSKGECDNVMKLSKKLLADCECNVLCSSFRKIVKNQKVNKDMDETKFQSLNNQVQLNLVIKTIKLNPDDFLMTE